MNIHCALTRNECMEVNVGLLNTHMRMNEEVEVGKMSTNHAWNVSAADCRRHLLLIVDMNNNNSAGVSFDPLFQSEIQSHSSKWKSKPFLPHSVREIRYSDRFECTM